MRNLLRDAPALGVSILLHIVVLAIMALFKFQVMQPREQPAVETVFAEEREQEEFTQQVTVDKTVSENLSNMAGGVVSTAVGSTGGPPISQAKIEQSDKLNDDVQVNVSMINMPSMNMLGTDLGEGEVNGEVGARAEGYGAAMSRIAGELIRLMRKQPVLVVWVFDSSLSLTDDRAEIAAEFDKIYQELNIASEQAKVKGNRFESLETQIVSFSAGVTPHMKKPTGDLKQITEAIGKIKEDESGEENVFGAIRAVLDEYSKMAARTKRKLAVIVVSDESGDDTDVLEEVIQKSSLVKAPVYFLSREAIFGYPYASIRVKDEKTGLYVWPRIDRGPETAAVENLQWTGFNHRHGWGAANISSGFGPYSMVRLARESGGIFFLLSDVEEQLGGGLQNQRQYDDFIMREYVPLLMSKKQYEAERNQSKFRKTMWDIIQGLDPNNDDKLNFRWRFPIEQAAFREAGKQEFDKSRYAITKINQAIKLLESVSGPEDYGLESSMRWRAAYELMYAQLRAFNVRHAQYVIALDNHAKNWPPIKGEKTNHWVRSSQGKLLEPDEAQLKGLGIEKDDLENYRREAINYYKKVIDNHSGTPWALRASREMKAGFGITFKEHFRDPRLDEVEMRIPKL